MNLWGDYMRDEVLGILFTAYPWICILVLLKWLARFLEQRIGTGLIHDFQKRQKPHLWIAGRLPIIFKDIIVLVLIFGQLWIWRQLPPGAVEVFGKNALISSQLLVAIIISVSSVILFGILADVGIKFKFKDLGLEVEPKKEEILLLGAVNKAQSRMYLKTEVLNRIAAAMPTVQEDNFLYRAIPVLQSYKKIILDEKASEVEKGWYLEFFQYEDADSFRILDRFLPNIEVTEFIEQINTNPREFNQIVSCKNDGILNLQYLIANGGAYILVIYHQDTFGITEDFEMKLLYTFLKGLSVTPVTPLDNSTR